MKKTVMYNILIKLMTPEQADDLLEYVKDSGTTSVLTGKGMIKLTYKDNLYYLS